MHPFNPMAVWANTMQATMLVVEAQSVITMRMLGMAGIWSVTPAEDGRMLSEKVYALTRAATDSTRAAMNGAAPEAVVAAAIKPIRQKTRANARRLGKRGLKKG
ncbi:antifreeze protein [Yoonia sp. 208BN28-4]|uniref:antifreeze protein n=1 Tax=Yoonia sp. 208BN28-4 TaxID=3126505 RepID=UPI003098BCD5